MDQSIDKFWEMLDNHGGVPIHSVNMTQIHTIGLDFQNPNLSEHATTDAFNIAFFSFQIKAGEYYLNKLYHDLELSDWIVSQDEDDELEHQALEVRYKELVQSQETLIQSLQKSIDSYTEYRVGLGLTPFDPPSFSIFLAHEPLPIYEIKKWFTILSVARILSSHSLENHTQTVNHWMSSQQIDGRFDIEKDGIWVDARDVDRGMEKSLVDEVKRVLAGTPHPTWALKIHRLEQDEKLRIKDKLVGMNHQNDPDAMDDSAPDVPAALSHLPTIDDLKAMSKVKWVKIGSKKVLIDELTLANFKLCSSVVYNEALPLVDHSAEFVKKAVHMGSVPHELGLSVVPKFWYDAYKSSDDKIWRAVGRHNANLYAAMGVTRYRAIRRQQEIIAAFRQAIGV